MSYKDFASLKQLQEYEADAMAKSDLVMKNFPPPAGHPDFYKIVDNLKDLHSRKNHDYAAGGDPLGNFTRVANILAQYPNLKLSNPTVIAIVYALKQLDAVLWILSNGHSTKVEGITDRLQDVAVYSILEMILNQERKEGDNP